MISKDNIQAVYPLTRKQQALAYYSLQRHRQDPGFILLRFSVQGPLNRAAFERAWQRLAERHESLRMSLQTPGNQKSMLVAVKHCTLPIEWLDLRDLDSGQKQAKIESHTQSLRSVGLDLSSVPVHKLLALHAEDEVVEVFWACHHLLLDGWSAIVLLQDMAQLYGNERTGKYVVEPARSTYADYLAWLRSQSAEKARLYWTEVFRGFAGSASMADLFPCSPIGLRPAEITFREHQVIAGLELHEAVSQCATSLKVTSATIVYAAWAVYLAAINNCEDIAYGTTTAGRSFDLPDREKMTGYFANVIPRRCKLDCSLDLATLVRNLHKSGFSSLPYDHVPLDEIQEWCGFAVNQALFDTLILFENLPLENIDLADPAGVVTIGDFTGDLTSTFPLTLTIRPATEWRFKFIYNQELSADHLRPVLDLFPVLLQKICLNPTGSTASMLQWLRAELPDLTRGRCLANAIPASCQDMQQLPVQLARNSTELEVSRIWESVLGVFNLDVHTDFLVLGGRSIVAVRMLSLIEERLGSRLSMIDLVSQPTIAGLSSLIDGTSSSSNWRSLVLTKPGGSRPPVIFIHAVGSHALFLRSLTPHFDSDQPVIGVQPVGLDGECPPMRTVPEIAGHYLAEILAYQPHGPYYLVAHCMGAVVAYEIMRLLKDRGESIAMFVVLDARAPLLEPAVRGVSRIANVITELTGKGAKGALPALFMRKLGVHLWYLAGVRFVSLRQKYWLVFGPVMARKKVYLEWVHEACLEGFWSYIGTPIDNKITLIASELDGIPLHMEWKALASDFEVITLPIGHETMFVEPEVGILANALVQLIERASEEQNSQSN